MSLPQTQTAVAMVAKRAPLVALQVPVHPPGPGEVTVRVAWTASSPLDLHRADGGLLVPAFPAVGGGGGIAGAVAAVGPGVSGLAVGDAVMAFAFGSPAAANHQEYVTVAACCVGRVPAGVPLRAACTVPVNVVTVFHTATADLGLALPWPVPPAPWAPPAADRAVLVWGAGSSVGLYAVQVLRHWCYRRVVAVADARHHARLRRLGAAACVDRAAPDVAERILAAAGPGDAPAVPFVLDCIGSLEGSLRPLTRVAQPSARVAVMLPVVVRDASPDREPAYEMDVSRCLPGEWAAGVVVRGARTHFYLDNDFFREHLQPDIVPALLAAGAVEPNHQRVVERATAVEHAQKALDLLRSKAISGERLVLRVAD